MSRKPTLLILAAGMGSRYGGLKQLDPMGPHGETVLDYSVHDALRAGFGKVVFVIRRDIEEPFRATVGRRYEEKTELAYVFQQLEDLPAGYSVPNGRSKPWGTAHALRAARNAIKGPFAVINADDFYGADAYAVMARYLGGCSESGRIPLGMVCYPLSHTLSEHGAVNRGICRTEEGRLLSIEEITDIERDRAGTILGTNRLGKEVRLRPEDLVSMNFWGFSDQLFQPLERHFVEFLKYEQHVQTAEFYIPTFVDGLIAREAAVCDLLETGGHWFGVTYPGDKPFVQEHLRALIESGEYPSPLFPDQAACEKKGAPGQQAPRK
jgi:hypothetical protein